jgi:hypothetical protein
MHTRLLLAVALGLSCDGKDDTASGDESDTDTDTDTDTDYHMTASGTFDGKAFEVDCPPDTLVTTRTGEEKGTVTAICATGASTGVATVTVSSFQPAEGAVTVCDPATFVMVTQVTGAYYTCIAGGGIESFEVDLTEVTSDADATVWGGTFEMTGDDGSHAVEVSGSFRARSADM